MFLKTVTLHGFKSFADRTVLQLEPGITVLVGPNGSGKSNVVDALTWVLGTSSAKSVRGGAMADVVFAGSAGASPRPAVGRAAVEITIDNSAGLLPIDYSEVTVGRSMFVTGENLYTINGTECRLLDVQELLSDTGLGREHHTIVGQGQLDGVLNARPEERRALIDEAAGVLKHRRRRERALRKLVTIESHVERLSDLLRELRRQRGPLRRQAEAAARHAELNAALREVRIASAVQELAGLVARDQVDGVARAARDERLVGLDARLADARAAEHQAERLLSELGPQARQAVEVHVRLAGLTERARGLAERVDERRAALSAAVEDPVAAADSSLLRARAAAERQSLEDLAGELADAAAALEGAGARRRAAESDRRGHDELLATVAAMRAEAREQALRREGEVSALRSAIAQAAGEEGRLASQIAAAGERRRGLETDLSAVEAEIQQVDAGSTALTARLAEAERLVAQRRAAADSAARKERELERSRASLEARADALHAASVQAGEGASVLAFAAASGELHGIAGSLAELLQVEAGWAAAVATALGPVGEALVVTGRAAAEHALGFARERNSGRVVLLVDGSQQANASPDPRDAELAATGARPLIDRCRGPEGVLAALRPSLAGVYAVSDLDTAYRLAAGFPDLVFVTAGGEVAGVRGYAGGSAPRPGAVVTRAAAREAEAEVEAVGSELSAASRDLADADEAHRSARDALETATAAVQESDGLLTAAAERLARLGKELAICDCELEMLRRTEGELDREVAARRQRLADLELAAAPSGTPPAEDHKAHREEVEVTGRRLDALMAEAREEEVQARLSLTVIEQRAEELRRRIAALDHDADEVEHRAVAGERRRERRLAMLARCGTLAEVAARAVTASEASLAQASAERDALAGAQDERQRELEQLRSEVRELSAQREEQAAEAHADELRGTELRYALELARTRLRDELGVDPDRALHERAAATEPPLPPEALAEEERRLAAILGSLGRVNPFAVQENAELAERERFLTGQLDDLEASIRDLRAVVAAVDGRIQEVFAAAFADVAREFARVFPRLFPGGEGRLVLTDPDDLLTTGVEVEARPPGKRVRRQSLLSGGERALTALAVLFAIFAARPSPFYVLDEVEAALDDVNLQRFLDLLGDFERTSQLVVVTHQRRTMEIADTLYGVSMRGDGVSRVVSQRVRPAVSRASPSRVELHG